MNNFDTFFNDIISIDGSLKLKEYNYIYSKAYAASELRHESINLIENRKIVISMLTQNDLIGKILSDMLDVKNCSTKVMVITTA